MAYNVLLTSLALPTFELESSGLYGFSEDSYVVASAVVPQPRNMYPVLAVAVKVGLASLSVALGSLIIFDVQSVEAVPPPPLPTLGVAE